jgi:hypothetical protein
MERKFALGRIEISSDVERTFEMEDVLAALTRFASADWGEVDSEQSGYNDVPLETDIGFNIAAEYLDRRGRKFCIDTLWEPRLTRVRLFEV